ncbi:MAG: T9SS type A sorting domain-containing protein [Bacteroidota bacterium]
MKRTFSTFNSILVLILLSTAVYGQPKSSDLQKKDILTKHIASLQDVEPGITPVSITGQPEFDYTRLVTSDATKGILYENGPFITHPGAGSGGSDYSQVQDNSLGLITFGFGMQIGSQNRLADDFIVTGNWIVSTITFYGYQTESGPPSTINEIRFQIYDDDPSAGGTIIYGDMTNNRLISSSWTNVWRVQESDPVENRPIMEIVADASGLELLPGVYWIEWQAGGSGNSGPWANVITILGETTTGNALQNNNGDWVEILDGGLETPQGFPFIINGSFGPQDDNDLAIAKILAPTSGYGMNVEEVTVRIGNYGNNDQSGFDVSYTLDSVTVVTETVSDTVFANTIFEYTFTQTASFSTFGDHVLEACTMLANDDNPDNDCNTETIENAQGMAVFPDDKEYWTGTTDSVTKTQNSLVHCLGGPTEVGWMKFDLSEVPDDEPITAVTFVGYVNETLFPFWSISPLLSDPLSTSAPDLFTEIQAGLSSQIAYSYNNENATFSPGWHAYQLGNGVLTDINNAVANDWFAVGIASRDNDPFFFLKFDGWNEANIPYLIVYYGDSASLCEPVYTTGCEYGDGFDDFIMEEIVNLETGCENNAGPGWSEYFDLGPATLEPGETYTVSMKTHYTLNYATIWIDFNDDMILSDYEKIISNFVFQDTGVLCHAQFTIPYDANPGLHHMRARTRFNNGCNEPCDIYDFGEAEDYYVQITGSVGECENFLYQTEIYPNPATDLVNVKSDHLITEISVYSYNGQILAYEQVDKRRVQINTAHYNPGIYLFKIESDKGIITKRIIIQ